jgi:hypothetical protein
MKFVSEKHQTPKYVSYLSYRLTRVKTTVIQLVHKSLKRKIGSQKAKAKAMVQLFQPGNLVLLKANNIGTLLVFLTSGLLLSFQSFCSICPYLFHGSGFSSLSRSFRTLA